MRTKRKQTDPVGFEQWFKVTYGCPPLTNKQVQEETEASLRGFHARVKLRAHEDYILKRDVARKTWLAKERGQK